MPALTTALFTLLTALAAAPLIARGEGRPAFGAVVLRVVPVALLLGALIAVAERAFGSEAWGLAVLAMLGQGLAMASQVAKWRRFFRLCDGLATADGIARLEGLLALTTPPPRARDRTEWARRIVLAAPHLHHAGDTARARAWLAAVSTTTLAEPLATAALQQEIAYAVALGDREGAKRGLAARRRPAPPPYEPVFEAFEALVAALEGDGSDALLERATRGRSESTGAAAATWLTTEAHVHATRGDEALARARLAELERGFGAKVRARVAGQQGPASRWAVAPPEGDGAYR